MTVDASKVVLSKRAAQSSHPLMAEYVFMVLAGLRSQKPHTKSATIQVLAALLYHFRVTNASRFACVHILYVRSITYRFTPLRFKFRILYVVAKWF